VAHVAQQLSCAEGRAAGFESGNDECTGWLNPSALTRRAAPSAAELLDRGLQASQFGIAVGEPRPVTTHRHPQHQAYPEWAEQESDSG